MFKNFNANPKGKVKLNNPLTGTETIFYPCYYYYHGCQFVKLNNPLTGTETINHPGRRSLLFLHGVKLNNPLTGTET